MQVPAYLHAGARQFGFMLRGLRELEGKLAALNIPFFLLKGDPAITIPGLVTDTKAGLLVADFGPLRLGREWRDKASPYCFRDRRDTANPICFSSDRKGEASPFYLL